MRTPALLTVITVLIGTAPAEPGFEPEIEAAQLRKLLKPTPDLLARNYEKEGPVSAHIAAQPDWILAVDNQMAIRRTSGRRRADLRIFADGTTLVHPRQLQAKQGFLGKFELKQIEALLRWLAEDPQTEEVELDKPLGQMSVEERTFSKNAMLWSTRPGGWDSGGPVVAFELDGKLYARRLNVGSKYPVFDRLYNDFMRRARAGGPEGMQPFLKFANAEMEKRVPGASAFGIEDFWDSNFDWQAHHMVGFKYTDRAGSSAKAVIKRTPSGEFYVEDASIERPALKEQWGSKRR